MHRAVAMLFCAMFRCTFDPTCKGNALGRCTQRIKWTIIHKFPPSHLLPLKPSLQTHSNNFPPCPGLHVPPFSQGLGSQGFPTAERNQGEMQEASTQSSQTSLWISNTHLYKWSHCQQSLVCIRKSRSHKLLAHRSDHTCQLKEPNLPWMIHMLGWLWLWWWWWWWKRR